jgi:hypothetical protein
MKAFEIALVNVVVWGAGISYYYLLYVLKKKGIPVIWFQRSPQAFQNYKALFAYIREESDLVVRKRVAAILWFHIGCALGMVVLFVMLVLGWVRF